MIHISVSYASQETMLYEVRKIYQIEILILINI